MKKTALTLFLVLCLFISSLPIIPTAQSAIEQTIYVRHDGTIEPPTAPLQQNGETYTLTSNINSSIVLERNSIILDGAGFTVKGDGTGVAVNMTCINAVAQNLKITNWECGVLGVFNNNTIRDCYITQCGSGIKIYAQYYAVVSNQLIDNDEGVRVGEGGLNFFAGNTISENQVGLILYDSGNLIVQNTILDSSTTAIHLMTQGWNQLVYGNNFEDNNRCLIDDTTNRPDQTHIYPWDDGSRGNYWSDYTGVDTSGSGIGDIPYIIDTYRTINGMADYNNVDRYPLTAPVNIAVAVPGVPVYLSAAAAPPAPNPENQAKAFSFLSDVLGLDLSQYVLVNGSESGFSDSIGAPIAQRQATYLQYSFHTLRDSMLTGLITIQIILVDGNVVSCRLICVGGAAYFKEELITNSDIALQILSNYAPWTSDPEVQVMKNLMDAAISDGVTNKTQGDLRFTVESVLSLSGGYNITSFGWYNTFNDAPYTGATLEFTRFNEHIIELVFTDNRGLYQIGNTNITISKEQAIQIAEDYITQTYSCKVFSKGFLKTIDNLVLTGSSTASLATTIRDPTTLYPYWSVQLNLDDASSEFFKELTVNVWADSGRVIDAQHQITQDQPSPSDGYFDIQAILSFSRTLLMVFVIIATCILVALIALVFYLRKRDKAAKPQIRPRLVR
ncbi:MAG: hypothetical protein NWF00_03010 [Candidatus Bathyarchaeota archaeon]|nr:hypothetical protein [Candidatus Bathyarchaeota archaeon]